MSGVRRRAGPRGTPLESGQRESRGTEPADPSRAPALGRRLGAMIAGLLMAGMALPGGAGAAAGGAESKATDHPEGARNEPAVAGRPRIFDSVEVLRLDNGMLFVLLPRPDMPTVSGRIWFRVGNVDCPAGESGLAHMLEHMAFKGTDRIGTRHYPEELAVQRGVDSVGTLLAHEVMRRDRADTSLVSRLRADLQKRLDAQEDLLVPNEFPQVYDGYTYDFNAWTSEDFTAYTADLPANNLEVWMLMESERIKHPVFREFYTEREVVKEERRERDDDDPGSMAEELLFDLAFTAHPYRTPVAGYMSEIEVLTQGEMEKFRGTYYVPGNAVAALVGGFDPVVAKRMIRDYFGNIPAGPTPPQISTVEPPHHGLRRGIHRQGTERHLFMAFPGVSPMGRGAVVAELLADVLGRDETSRLQRRLINADKSVRDVTVSWNEDLERYPGLFTIDATPLPGFTNEQVEKAVWDELDRVVREPVTPGKLREIQAARRKEYYRSLATNASVADALARNQAVFGDWQHTYTILDVMDSVTADEITSLARDLFQQDQATVVDLEPAPAAGADSTGAAPQTPQSNGGGR